MFHKTYPARQNFYQGHYSVKVTVDSAVDPVPSAVNTVINAATTLVNTVAVRASALATSNGQDSSGVAHSVTYSAGSRKVTVDVQLTVHQSGLEHDLNCLLGHGLTELHELPELLELNTNEHEPVFDEDLLEFLGITREQFESAKDLTNTGFNPNGLRLFDGLLDNISSRLGANTYNGTTPGGQFS